MRVLLIGVGSVIAIVITLMVILIYIISTTPIPPIWLPEPAEPGRTLSPVPAVVESRLITYADDCEACGASFRVDNLQIGRTGSFRLHMNIRNADQLSDLRYMSATAYLLNAAQAELYVSRLAEAQAPSQFGALLSEVTPNRFASPILASVDALPAAIAPGREWQGWVGFAFLPRDTIGLVLILVPEPGSSRAIWISSTPERPFIPVAR